MLNPTSTAKATMHTRGCAWNSVINNMKANRPNVSSGRMYKPQTIRSTRRKAITPEIA
jgi:hypothetical protein